MVYKDSDIDDWPKTWAYSSKDIDYGKEIVELFVPFLNSLKQSKFSKKTINEHIDNLWALGGFLIKQINYNEEYRNKTPLLLIPRYIDSYDGPTIQDFSESEQESFDKTCSKYYRYLVVNDLKRLLESDFNSGEDEE